MSDAARGPGDWSARLTIHPTAWIAPGAVVVGDVTIGARSSVWFNTVVRGDTDRIAVGDDSNLQDLSVVHVDEGQPAIIGSRVTVGHRAILHGCVIQDDCLIGMGAIVLSGARVGNGSLVGAGALVREGQVIPPRSLAVGAPARVVGEVGEAHRVAIRHGSTHYAELAASYRQRGFVRMHPLANSDAGITPRERGPLTFLEWSQLLGIASGSVAFAAERLARHPVEAWRRAPGPRRWCAVEVLCHLRDTDREIWVPRLERFLTETNPEFPDGDLTGWDERDRYRDQDPATVLEEWRRLREGIVARLAPLRREDWARPATHAVRGSYSLAEMLRYLAEHDLSHRRQMAEALGEFA
jgi:carbonic anhydrase/acetyltransferase-like protein (isoleucine patch superfamily)/uncharacterized damage-inducible protein DinB